MIKFMNTLLITIIIIISPLAIFSQNHDTSANKDHRMWHKTDFYWKKFSPTIQLFYSWNSPSLSDEKHRDYQDPFLYKLTEEKAFEARFGNTTDRELYPDDGISETAFSSIYLKYMGKSNILNNELEADGILLKQIQFGIFTSKGYGYKSKADWFGIYLYTGGSINWNDLNYDIPANLNLQTSLEALQTYKGTLRFGQSFESGIKIKLPGPLNVIGAYEKSVVYPRHLFWKWTVSQLIESIGTEAADQFAHAVMRSSPYAGPIVNFVIKTGILLGMYELRKNNMNWPFTTSPPLVTDSWKIGLSLEF